MSSLTSFHVLCEPPQSEEPPENVLSKIFQRFKTTLSTPNIYTPSGTSTDTPSRVPFPTHTATAATSAVVNSQLSSSGTDIDITGCSPSITVSPFSTESLTARSSLGNHTNVAVSSSSVAGPSYPVHSDTEIWDTLPDKNSKHGSSVKSSNNRNQSTDNKDHTIVMQRYPTAATATKRASSLFKVSTIDHSITHDDDSASLASLAPPVVSLSPAFGDKQSAMHEMGISTRLGRQDNQAVGHTRLSAGDNSVLKHYIHHTLGPRDTSADSDARSIKSFGSGHQKANSLTKLFRRIRGEGVSKDYWMADENAKECYGCNVSFAVYRRRHHCRMCGHVLCSKCALKTDVKFDYDRLCDYCLKSMGRDAKQENEANEYTVGTAWTTPAPLAAQNHFNQQLPISPGISATQNDNTPFDGILKLLHAGSHLFLARSRSNTATGEQIDGGIVPFRRSLALEDYNINDSVLDPEVVPFLREEEDDYDELWSPGPSSVMSYASLNNVIDDEDVNNSGAPGHSSREWLPTRVSRADEIRGMFIKDRSSMNRRIGVNGGRSNRALSLSLETRGLLRSDGSESARSPMDIRPATPFFGSNSQSLLHLGRHPRLLPTAGSVMELNSASLQHMRRLLQQLLARFEIDSSDGWEDVIMKHVLKVSNSIQVLGDMDVMEVVKIKKIPGGTAQDTMYINGVVCTKNLAHKQMNRTLQNPRILLLSFALEYQRKENHFMSLTPIMDQEREYLTHLVARVVALRPHIIIVEKTVSRVAMELLLKHNVAVAYNVKLPVIVAIAEATGADIITSFDRLDKEPHLGICGTFEVKTFVHKLIPNKRKSYMFFQDCPGNLFCSLVLRGGSLDILNRIKKIVGLMVRVSYNLKLETSLMNDQFAMTSAPRESRALDDEKIELSSDPEIRRLQESLLPYKQTILSASPFVKFSPPFLLTAMIDDMERLKMIEKTATPTALRDIRNARILLTTSSTNNILNKVSTGRSQDSGLIEGSYIDILNDYQAKEKAWEDFLSSNKGPPHIVPFDYQGLPFLYSFICMSTKATCIRPSIGFIKYYFSDCDTTLAHHLVQICWKSKLGCMAPGCGRPLQDHQYIYAHGDAKITVTIEQWDSPTILKKDSIMMWSKCKICHVETPQVYISDDTKNYSFGKFLELIFYQTNLTCRANICPHDINRNHIRFFGLDTQLVKIERIPIKLFDITFPPMLVRCKPEFYARTKTQDLDLVRSQITRYWDSVMERIKNVVPPSKFDAAKQELLDMSKNVLAEKSGILQLLQQTYLNSAPTDTLALDTVRIKLYDKSVEWDKIFGDFARQYFNLERDFRRSTASQLRRLFDEKEFPATSDPEHRANLMHDLYLPMTLDTDDSDDSIGGHYDLSALPYLGSSPTHKAAKSRIEEGDAAASESTVEKEKVISQITFPFIESKVTRRLSMILMQEHRPKLTHALTSDSVLGVPDEDLNDKAKRREPSSAFTIARTLPVSTRNTTRISSRLSMASLPTYDPMTLIQQERKENQQIRASLVPTPSHSGSSSPLGVKDLSEKFIIPLDRTPTGEKPSSASSTSSGKNPFFSKPRQQRPTEKTPFNFSPSSPPVTSVSLAEFSKPRSRRPTDPTFSIAISAPSVPSTLVGGCYPSSNTLIATNLGTRRSKYLARAQGSGNTIPAHHSSAGPELHKNLIVNRSRSFTQPIPGSTVDARARYMNALSGRNSQQEENKHSTVVFSSAKEAAKEESEDEDDYQSESEGDEPYQPSRGYTFSLIQTDAMDEALGSEDPLAIEASYNFRNNNAWTINGSAGGVSSMSNNEEMFLDPVMMFLGDDDYSCDQRHRSGQRGAVVDQADSSTSAMGSPVKASSMNMSVSGTLSAALAAASKLPQLSEVAEGVERGSLIKTLSNFWQDRNSRNFTPLNYPLQPSEHVIPGSQIIVREDEPSSIIALTLSSPRYVDELRAIFRAEGVDADQSKGNSTASISMASATIPAEDGAQAPDSNGNGLSNSFVSSIEGIYDDIQVLDDSLLSEPGTHMKFMFRDDSTMLYCKIFYMEQFHALRKAAGCEYSYIQSLARCMKWEANGGKSGSSFLKTRDDRFIMKQLSKVELEAFIKFAPHYFEYMQNAFFHKQPTVLAKIFGFYRVGYKHGALGRSMNMDVLVMENLFYDRKKLKIFDLKGSRRNRYVHPSGKENEVLLDENFSEFMSESPFFIREHAKLQLSKSLQHDCQFLQRFNIMDYSLLVAVADDRQEILVGIVDFIRPFTWDKKLESWVKDAVGSQEPTIVSPAQYCKRFCAAMDRHLDMVPDRWYDTEPRNRGAKVYDNSCADDFVQDYDHEWPQYYQPLRGQEQQKAQMKLYQHHPKRISSQNRGSSSHRAPSQHEHYRHHHPRYSANFHASNESGLTNGISARPTSGSMIPKAPSSGAN
ncbi:1-phosphatidylinositol-3-phosphate 5-kinase [Lobosporangium transversale]|uniref:1-phosphatidylinositol-3-phosphate 5-kinase n=1 Tax=Lobosporangium transversale TaxID=64571 RepID=A0A1Y2G876_9FUNG|nr:hypothetical protein BCR41DRAFT_426491 [Lobosporangium transversale]KAF9918276.1 1-phosphatidylinositol-3-phosphate 5-kinase [Lobosporangium transversale]ORY99511.1 hypothetical protein BCR41DRAFT_426491 [Lobosporangium transversale]|eukprot:XP_021875837.1 hypothetical protein BCR41DRAFT_426491 [Lobosporangium transversale]